jgi:hypothetical protein
MALKAGLFLFILILVACGGDSTTPQNTPVPVNEAALPQFRQLSEFPGSISGFDTAFGLIRLVSNEVCFDLENRVVTQTIDEIPLAVRIGVDEIADSAFFVKVDDETGEFAYCFNPILGNGVYTLNIELINSDSVEIYGFDFRSDRPNPLRLREFPGEVTGLTRLTDDEISDLITRIDERPVPIFRLSDTRICIIVANEIVLDVDARGMIEIALDGRILSEQQVFIEPMADAFRFCITAPDTPGVHNLYIQLTLTPGVSPRRVAYQGAFIVDEST